ncbi:MAG: M48 family metalloprotease [Thermodesulfovibrionales bacterium]
MRRTAGCIGIFLAPVLLFGCETIDIGGTGIAQHLGMLNTAAVNVQKASREITDEEEYYVGRAVAARILALYPLSENAQLTEYVNAMGLALSLQSEKPFTYGGYHFAVLDTPEVNAFACPGGIIFVTRGMIRAAANEDQLAAVLAHEIAHVSHRDGIAAISKARWTEALTVIGAKAVREYGPHEVAQLAGIFEGAIEDVFRTVVVDGYSTSQERQADQKAVGLLAKTGYDAAALKELLAAIPERDRESGGMLTTHPPTQERIETVAAVQPDGKADPALVRKRSNRFRAAVR